MRGFTLVELMIVVAIVAILSAVALPSYRAHTCNGERADAQAVLLQSRQQMERFYSKNYTYVGASAGNTIPAKAPIDGTRSNYTLSINNLTASTYTILATLSGGASGGSSCPCGNLSITQAGVRAASSGTIATCWG